MTLVAMVWFRRDLRLRDHTALLAAVERGAQVIPVFVLDPALLGGRNASPARVAFMLAGLRALDADLRALGSRLLVRTGEPLAVLAALAAESGASELHFNRDYTPFAQARDRRVEDGLPLPVFAHDDALIHPPGAVMKSDGSPYRMFTPYLKVWSALPTPGPDDHPLRPASFADSAVLACESIPAPGWGGALPPAGETPARQRLASFAAGPIYHYAVGRNRLSDPAWIDSENGTSALSPHLRFGMISSRQALTAARMAAERAPDETARRSARIWITELAWRDFYFGVLVHTPRALTDGFKTTPSGFEWRHAPDELARWQAGVTGFPVIDAAMRQLAALGWMHNRARMIVAAFLSKDLLLGWREGEAHFMRHLLDGDPAANNGGWQWAAGTGTDAQPFFRIFNPVLQSRRYDPAGDYIRRWVPELRDVPTAFVHAPWEMPVPPAGYPAPMVDHAWARDRALAAWKRGRARA